ncbi:MAG: sensor histidine kinase [Planctomycetota bacterium]|jgi:PAS domain S-box-containing protein
MPKSRKKTRENPKQANELRELRSKTDRIEKTLTRAQESLGEKQSELDRARVMLETLPGGVCLVVQKGRIDFANKALADILGMKQKQLLKKKFIDLVSSEDRARVEKETGAAGDRLPARVEFTTASGKGVEKSVQVTSTPLYGKDKKFIGSLALVTDISERRNFIRKLQSLAGLHAAILRHAPLGVLTVDRGGFITNENQTMRKFFGGGKTWIGFNAYEIPGVSKAGIDSALNQAFRGKKVTLSRIRFHPFVEEAVRIVDIEIVPVDDEGADKIELVVIFVTDRTEASKADEMRQILASIVENSSDAVISTDLDGKFQAWNPAAETMYGYTAQEILGQPVDMLMRDRAPEWANIRQKLTRGEIIFRPRARRLRKDGSPIDVSIVLAPIRDESGEIVGTSGIHRDISERARWEETLEAKNRELESINRRLLKLDEMKDAFLETISHELRSPLLSARGYIDLLRAGQMGPLSEDAKVGLGVAHRNIEELITLIGDLITLSSLTARGEEIKREEFSTHEAAEMAAAQLRILNPKKKIVINLEFPEDLPRAFGNVKLFERVFGALLSNAEKFSEPAAFITVSAHRLENGLIEISVADRGIGIPPDRIGHIFEKFYQVDGTRAKEYGGSGLGLALAKAIVEIHGGEIRAESGTGEGARITFTIPTAQ